jgi:hypothetical protein
MDIVAINIEAINIEAEVNKRIDEAIESSINFLDLSGLDLTYFPKRIFEIKSLMRMNLSGNKINIIPDNIGELGKLKYLNLSNNIIVDVTKEISKLKELTYLDLSQNQIEDFPEGIYELKKLINLILFGNQIDSITERIEDLEKLCYIALENNPLLEDCMYYCDKFNEERGKDVFFYDKKLFKEITIWEKNLRSNNLRARGDKLKNIISNSEGLQKFISGINNLSKQQWEGFQFVLHKIDPRYNNEEERANYINIMIGATGDCLTPKIDALIYFFIKKHEEAGTLNEIQDVLTKAAVGDFIIKNPEKIGLTAVEAIEQAQGLLDAAFLSNNFISDHYNKSKILNTKYNVESNTINTNFCFNQVSYKAVDRNEPCLRPTFSTINLDFFSSNSVVVIF